MSTVTLRSTLTLTSVLTVASGLILMSVLPLAGCAPERRVVPRMPAGIPTELPSEIEASLRRAGDARSAAPETTTVAPSNGSGQARPEMSGPVFRPETASDRPASGAAVPPSPRGTITPGQIAQTPDTQTPGAQTHVGQTPVTETKATQIPGAQTQVAQTPVTQTRVAQTPPAPGTASRAAGVPTARPPQETAPAYDIPGYRVQVFATSRESVARLFAERMRSKCAGENQKVYVVEDGTLYKVRIGDCRTREEALQLRGRLLEHGQKDAFVISTRIYWPLSPETPGAAVEDLH